MNWEVVEDDTTLDQVVDVHLLFKGLQDDGLELSSVELIEHIASVALEGQLAIILRETALNTQDLSHEIDDRVVEVEHNHHGVVASGRLIEILLRLNLVIDRVVNTTTVDKGAQLTQQKEEGIGTGHKAVVR